MSTNPSDADYDLVEDMEEFCGVLETLMEQVREEAKKGHIGCIIPKILITTTMMEEAVQGLFANASESDKIKSLAGVAYFADALRED